MTKRDPKKLAQPKIKFVSMLANSLVIRISFVLVVIIAIAAVLPKAEAAGFWNWDSITYAFAGSTADKSGGGSGIWREVSRAAVTNGAAGIPADSRTFALDRNALSSLLTTAPHESVVPLGRSEVILSLPMPDGNMARFRIQEAPVMEPSMEKRFPEIKSYRVLGIDDPTMTGRFDLTPRGFHANLITNDRIVNILPADSSDPSLYASYADIGRPDIESGKHCSVSLDHEIDPGRTDLLAPEASVGPVLRTYRIAVSTTFEYTSDPALGGGTIPSTVASINTWLNGINAIYEREVSVRLYLVNDTDAIYTANNDPYDDSPGNSVESVMLNQVRPTLRDQVGPANYNLGHLLTKNSGGGVAYLGVICQDGDNGGDGFGPLKGGGVSVVGAPVGGSLKLLAHELGHQFGAQHTFNGTLNSCSGGNRSSTTAYETGSGSTIMSYAAICGSDNITNSTSDTRFHTGSFAQITNHTINGGGNACPGLINTGNAAPNVTTPAGFNIPRNTPFTLTAVGSDPDAGDVNNLSYVWEQTDVGGTNFFQNGTEASYNDAADPVNATTRPIFRAFPVTTGPSRTFPSLTYILNNANDPPLDVSGLKTAEELPRIGRTLNFRVTARDQVGGVNEAATVLTVDNASGPFVATDFAGPWTGGTVQAVTWSVAGTTAAPVSAANVRISLSTNGGLTFPIELAASTPNDGTENVNVPTGLSTTTARIKVEAVGNIFFDISGTNFTITPGNACPIIADFSPKVASVGTPVIITGTGFTGVTGVTFSTGVTAVFTVDNDGQITATVPAGAVGGPITLTEAGCGAAASANFTVCPGAAATIQVDDGSFESATVSGGTGNVSYYVNRLTPAAYPATLSQVRINFPSFGGVTAGMAVNIVTGTNTDGDANINNTSFQSVATTVTAVDTFVTYNVAPITINSGDFVVGFNIVHPGGGFFPGAVDTSPPNNARSYQGVGGASFSAVGGGNLLIRAGAFTGACTNGACTYTITPTPQNIPFGGGAGVINITTQAGCTWSATRNNNWLTLTSAANGVGSGALNFSASQNYSGARTGTITVAGQTTALVGDNIVINQAAAPVAAGVSVSGRVLTPDGQGVRGAVITIAGLNGEPRTARTGSFGYYRFDDILVGETYLISVASKRYQFTPRTIGIFDELTDVDFVAEP